MAFVMTKLNPAITQVNHGHIIYCMIINDHLVGKLYVFEKSTVWNSLEQFIQSSTCRAFSVGRSF